MKGGRSPGGSKYLRTDAAYVKAWRDVGATVAKEMGAVGCTAFDPDLQIVFEAPFRYVSVPIEAARAIYRLSTGRILDQG